MKKPRRHFPAIEKVAVLKRHLVEKVAVSDLCNELDIAPTLFYGWLKAFFENGHAAFDNGRKTQSVEDAKDKKIEQLEAKLQRKNEVVAELLEEHTLLKKSLGCSERPLDPARYARRDRRFRSLLVGEMRNARITPAALGRYRHQQVPRLEATLR